MGLECGFLELLAAVQFCLHPPALILQFSTLASTLQESIVSEKESCPGNAKQTKNKSRPEAGKSRIMYVL